MTAADYANVSRADLSSTSQNCQMAKLAGQSRAGEGTPATAKEANCATPTDIAKKQRRPGSQTPGRREELARNSRAGHALKARPQRSKTPQRGFL